MKQSYSNYSIQRPSTAYERSSSGFRSASSKTLGSRNKKRNEIEDKISRLKQQVRPRNKNDNSAYRVKSKLFSPLQSNGITKTSEGNEFSERSEDLQDFENAFNRIISARTDIQNHPLTILLESTPKNQLISSKKMSSRNQSNHLVQNFPAQDRRIAGNKFCQIAGKFKVNMNPLLNQCSNMQENPFSIKKNQVKQTTKDNSGSKSDYGSPSTFSYFVRSSVNNLRNNPTTDQNESSQFISNTIKKIRNVLTEETGDLSRRNEINKSSRREMSRKGLETGPTNQESSRSRNKNWKKKSVFTNNNKVRKSLVDELVENRLCETDENFESELLIESKLKSYEKKDTLGNLNPETRFDFEAEAEITEELKSQNTNQKAKKPRIMATSNLNKKKSDVYQTQYIHKVFKVLYPEEHKLKIKLLKPYVYPSVCREDSAVERMVRNVPDGEPLGTMNTPDLWSHKMRNTGLKQSGMYKVKKHLDQVSHSTMNVMKYLHENIDQHFYSREDGN